MALVIGSAACGAASSDATSTDAGNRPSTDSSTDSAASDSGSGLGTDAASSDSGPGTSDDSGLPGHDSGSPGSSGDSGSPGSTRDSGGPGPTGDSGSPGSTGDSGSGTCAGGTAQAGDVTISESSLEQRITGFGVSSAWAGSFANASDPEFLWSTTTGAGLTLLRIRYGDGLTIAKAAVQYGVTVWMTPWGIGSGGATGGPDTTTETNPNGCTGSMPVLTNPQGLATSLVSWVQSAKSQGVPIYAVSAENEPDSCGINSTTSYSATELATWIGSYLGPAMAPLGVKVMAPETQNACGFTSYFSAIQNNAAAWSSVNIFASHEYGCGTLPTETSIAAADKEYWETEVDTGSAAGDSPGDGIASALLMATTMHSDLTKANLNAWHLWWLYENNGSGCLYDTGTKVWTKRLWVMGNYSRFVRPGYMRVNTSGTAASGVLISAYINPANNALSIVAINSNTSSASASFYISANAPCSLTPYETSAANSLGQLTPVTVSNSRVKVTLAAQSVTTFVGTP
jgi:glucuronoarabinoxylan endo-1,4-beta-xylanase